jgi:hypothetical protein
MVLKLNEVLNLKPSLDDLVQTYDCYMGRILRARTDEASEKNPRFTLKRFSSIISFDHACG